MPWPTHDLFRESWRSVFAALCVMFLLCAANPAVGDGPEKLAESALKMFNKALSDKDVPRLEEALSDFDAVYEKVAEKTVKKFHKAYGKLFKLAPRQEQREDGSDPRSELLGAYQLACGTVFDKDGGQEILKTALKQGHVKQWPDAEALFVEALGHRLEPENVKTIAGYLTDEQSAVVRAAVSGLGLLSEQDVAVRRSACKPLIDAFLKLSKAAEKEAKKGKKEDAQSLLLRVEGTFHDSLLKLTRQRLDTADGWAAWFKENGAGDRW